MNNISFTAHATIRMSQRAIRKEWIIDVISFGKKYYSSGCIIYVATIKKLELNKMLLHTNLDRLKGLIVITTNKYDSIEVVTSYKDSNFRKHIKNWR